MTAGIVGESDLSGTMKSEYVFFNGERVARRDNPGSPSATVAYYFSDHLKTASVITDSVGIIKADSDYYPWGGELQFVNADSNHYKFTGKERDSETNLDYFGARYYSNGLGRFITPDWAAKPAAVPYAEFADPQSLNLYTYVRNVPTTRLDADGHSPLDFLTGVANAVNSNFAFGFGRQEGGSTSFKMGQALGDGISLAGSVLETVAGTTLTSGGLAACGTGVGCIAGAPVAAVGTVTALHGVGMGATALSHIFRRTEQGRDAHGKFVAKNPGEAAPGSAAEKMGLESVGATKNNKAIPGSNRIPDGTIGDVTNGGQYVEVKDLSYISNTEQLREMGQAAFEFTGKPLMVVTTDPNVKITRDALKNSNLNFVSAIKK